MEKSEAAADVRLQSAEAQAGAFDVHGVDIGAEMGISVDSQQAAHGSSVKKQLELDMLLCAQRRNGRHAKASIYLVECQ